MLIYKPLILTEFSASPAKIDLAQLGQTPATLQTYHTLETLEMNITHYQYINLSRIAPISFPF